MILVGGGYGDLKLNRKKPGSLFGESGFYD